MSNDDHKQIIMSPAEVELLTEKVVVRTLQKFGIDTENPIDVQEQHQFVREWLAATKFVKGKLVAAAIGVIVVATLGMAWMGFKAIIK